MKRNGSHKKKDLKWKIIFITILTVVFCLIPLLFCIFFHGSGKSSFGMIHSDISADNWFSFWITYLAAISSVVVAMVSLNLTKKIENIQLMREQEADRLKFGISDVQDNDEINGLRIFLPMDIVSVGEVIIGRAELRFGGGETIIFIDSASENKDTPIKDAPILEGCSHNLIYPRQIDQSCKQARYLWHQQSSSRTKCYMYADLTMLFYYQPKTLKSKKKYQQVCSKIRIIVGYDDTNNKSNREIYKIVDKAVYNPIDDN